jgi:cyclophilin family peptidyl-prolyl cis-trans isomerase
MSKKFPQVYLDVSIGAKAAGRVIFELFTDLTPKTAENFRGMCTGEYGNVGIGSRTKKLHYLNTQFHRILDGFVLQGGDIINGDGSGGHSIYGPTYADENFERKHACAGLLSMANRGRNTNSSQFFITLKPAPHLDGKHTVFGQVIEGMETVRKMSKTPVDMNDKPKIPVIIIDCGEVNDYRNFLRYDPFKKSLLDEKQKQMLKEKEPEHVNEIQTTKVLETYKDEMTAQSDVIETDSILPVTNKVPADKMDKLRALKEKINAAKKDNAKAVLEEERKMNDPNYERRLKKDKWEEKKKEMEKQYELKGLDPEKSYLDQTALKVEHSQAHKKKNNETFGWDVFNEESLFRAYKKRLKNIPHYSEVYKESQDHSEDPKPNEERLNNLVQDMEKQEKKRQNFSRRRAFQDDEDINYINNRNKVFNDKLQRSFGEYTAEIKYNLERGTAN